MIFQYHPESDMLYIQLANGVSTESEEVAPGVVIDFNAENHVLGMEIEDASRWIDLSRWNYLLCPL
ncbi:MAG: DUF2283 domain-containing protein [Chloroflexi bacterium]|nr:DUF2283 domain-containing protein [Chloroflexota bacterium]